MTTQELPLDSQLFHDADVEHSRSTACWTVEERAWKQELPDLPDEVIALLATPVVVSASAWLAGHAGDPAPVEEVEDPAPTLTTPQFLAPAPPVQPVLSPSRANPRRRTAGRALPRLTVRIA